MAGQTISVQGANIGAVPAGIDPFVGGFNAWSYDNAQISTSGTVTAAIIHMSKIPIPKTLTITNLHCWVGVAGTSYTNGQLGLYSSAGTFLAATAVQASAGTNGFGAVGMATIALTAAQTITGGPTTFVWAAVHLGTNGATAVTIGNNGSISTGNEAVNGITTVATARWCYQTGAAANPLVTIGNLTPASNTLAVGISPFWMGAS